MTVVDPLDEPVPAVLGDLYWVDTRILWSGDMKHTRPVVVVEVPPDRHGRVAVVTRTSDTSRKGVPHDAVPEIGLNKPGVFADFRSAEAVTWTPRNVRRLAPLTPEVFNQVMDRFG